MTGVQPEAQVYGSDPAPFGGVQSPAQQVALIRVTYRPCIMQIDEAAPGQIRNPGRSPWISAL